MGYYLKMSDRSREACRRALAGLLVAALLIGVTHPLAAGEMVCKMDRPAAAPGASCAAFGPTSDTGSGPSFRAASCCHFQAPSETQPVSVTLSSALRALPGLGSETIALAIASVSPGVAAAASTAHPAAAAPAPTSSLTRASILRL